MGTKCAGSGGDPEQPNCEDPAFIASCTQSFMNVDGCSVMARAEAGELDDDQDIESALAGVDRQCFMCENIGEEVQAICQSQQGRAPKDILREIIDDAEQSVDILREIIEDAEELQDADLPADVKKLTVLMRDLTQAQKSLGKTKSKASKTRKRVKAANKTRKTRGQ